MAFVQKYVRLIIGIILCFIGIVLMLIPFLPIGYAFVFIGILLLATYIPFLNKFLRYLKEKDPSGILARTEGKILRFTNRFEKNH